MGGGSSRIENRSFECSNPKYNKIRKTPLTFNRLNHVRCIFFTQESYDANYHIPKSTLSETFVSTLNNLENDIEIKIQEVYNKVSSIAPAKILNPIYVAFARTLEYNGSIFDDPNLKKIEVNFPNNNYSLAIKDFMNSYLDKMKNPDLNKKYMKMPMNSYTFVNNRLKVIIYFPFMTADYKYITNFKDIINSSSFFTKVLLDTEFNGLPDVNTFNEAKERAKLQKSKSLTPEVIDYAMNKMKEADNTNFRYSDDLLYLCNEGGCLSESGGEDFNTLLPSLASNDADNDNVAIKMSPFLPNKCLAQTFRYKCGVLGTDNNNKSLPDLMKAEEIIKYLTTSLRKYIINEKCTLEKTDKIRDFCDREADKEIKIQQTPVDIINYTFSYQLRKQFDSDLNKGNVNHYSKDYSINIIKELMFLRNKYPGIQEIVFPLYVYDSTNNNLTIDPPWGSLFITSDHVFSYNENIVSTKFSFNNKYYLKMNSRGQITVNYTSNKQIYYYLNVIEYNSPLSMSFSSNISIIHKNAKNGNHETKQITKINLVIKDEKHREPYDFYINDEGKIRVFANGFIDATDKAFINFIDKKIIEQETYGSEYSSGFFNSYNEIDKTKINSEDAIYYDDENNKQLFNYSSK
uniref:Uncharacterized protein n=1 Tax=viral metagenome TaxID=1070528 RepID=A0A6C0LGJ6_9ZZZZ